MYVCDHVASLRISVKANFSTTLTFLASDKKLIELLHPTVSWKNFSTRPVTILLLPHTSCMSCALYYGMLIVPVCMDLVLPPSSAPGTLAVCKPAAYMYLSVINTALLRKKALSVSSHQSSSEPDCSSAPSMCQHYFPLHDGEQTRSSSLSTQDVGVWLLVCCSICCSVIFMVGCLWCECSLMHA